MFVTGSTDEKARTAWHGEPQHEEGVETGWERGFYGEPNEREAPGPIEFVPEVERRGRFAGNGKTESRPVEPSRVVAGAYDGLWLYLKEPHIYLNTVRYFGCTFI